jgi:hypothetical protein
MKKSAIISDCGLYRYELRREWDDKLPPMVVIMLNPSTADAEKDDPTISRCINRAQDLGFGSLIVGNLFAFRASDPRRLRVVDDPIGIKNPAALIKMLAECKLRDGKLLVAWGSEGRYCGAEDTFLTVLACQSGLPYYCLGKTKQGQPKHPLYVRLSQRLEPYV